MKHPKYGRAFEVTAELPPDLADLKRLARNFWWTWDHGARDLFKAVDQTSWQQSGHNPVAFLNRVRPARWAQLAQDTALAARVHDVAAAFDAYMTGPTWFGARYPELVHGRSIAYFCFEFGITEGLPIYSGGLGVLAGDHLKAASDLGLPLVGVGLLYNRGYFRQRLTFDGWQQEIYPQNDFYEMPLTLVRGQDGKPVRIDVEFPDRVVTLQVWRADVGRVALYLLDSNVLENQPGDQGITDSLYGGDVEMRLRQEMILGIGGMKALEAIGIRPAVCHMNEGHAAFLSIERIRQLMAEFGCDYRTARQVAVAGNVFTTHTPVPAGFDLFQPEVLERYMGKSIANVGLPFANFLKLGRMNPQDNGQNFNMAILAMEMADRVNAVSKLHAEVSRNLFSERWPTYPDDEVPIVPVTNGIHTQTWVSRRMANLFDDYLGPAWRIAPENPESWAAIENVPDEELWIHREALRADLVRFIRQRSAGRLGELAPALFDPRVLTIGFARRFATYKRGSLMLADRERLRRLLFHAERPVQIVISGKSHPRDDGGKHIIQDLIRFIQAEGNASRTVFLEDYDMRIARALVQGVDLWLNNPRRPYEASGTSGMKVVPNGGLNVSVLDGWWDEAYEPGLGWAIGERTQTGDQAQQDDLDSRSLYSRLENEISPTFYRRSSNGVPTEWVRMIKNSIRRLAAQFSSNRMVAQYANEIYVPAMTSFEELSADGCAGAKRALEWRDRVTSDWKAVGVISVTDTAGVNNVMGDAVQVRAVVELGSISPTDVRVQAVVGKVGPNRELMHTRVTDLLRISGEGSRHVFGGAIGCDFPGHQGYTVRLVPYHPDVLIPNELQLVTWEST
jgi:starch phosphorylase